MTNPENIRETINNAEQAIDSNEENNNNQEQREETQEEAREEERRRKEEERIEKIEIRNDLFSRIEREENKEEAFVELAEIAIKEYEELKSEQGKMEKKQQKNKEIEKIQGKIEENRRKFKHLEGVFDFKNLLESKKDATKEELTKEQKRRLGELIYEKRQDILDQKIIATENEENFKRELNEATTDDESREIRIRIEKEEKKQLRIHKIFDDPEILSIIDFERKEMERDVSEDRFKKREKKIEESRDRIIDDLLKTEDLPESERAVWVQDEKEDGTPLPDRLSVTEGQIKTAKEEMNKDFQERRKRDMKRRPGMGFGFFAMQLVINFYEFIGVATRFLMESWGVKLPPKPERRKKDSETKKEKSDKK